MRLPEEQLEVELPLEEEDEEVEEDLFISKEWKMTEEGVTFRKHNKRENRVFKFLLEKKEVFESKSGNHWRNGKFLLQL